MDTEEILYAVADRVATITLNRPDKLNAFTRRMRDELIDAFERADADDEVRAVIVTGGGPRLLRRRRPVGRRRAPSTTRTRSAADAAARHGATAADGYRCASSHRRKPVIAAINGAGGRRRRHHDAADGHPHRLQRGALRLRVRAARHRARGLLAAGSCRGWSA